MVLVPLNILLCLLASCNCHELPLPLPTLGVLVWCGGLLWWLALDACCGSLLWWLGVVVPVVGWCGGLMWWFAVVAIWPLVVFVPLVLFIYWPLGMYFSRPPLLPLGIFNWHELPLPLPTLGVLVWCVACNGCSLFGCLLWWFAVVAGCGGFCGGLVWLFGVVAGHGGSCGGLV